MGVFLNERPLENLNLGFKKSKFLKTRENAIWSLIYEYFEKKSAQPGFEPENFRFQEELNTTKDPKLINFSPWSKIWLLEVLKRHAYPDACEF